MSDRADSRFNPALYWGLLGVLFVLEGAWLAWYLTEPLPNGANIGGHQAHRWTFLALAFPAIIPGVRLEQSYVGMAFEKLSHVENLVSRFPIVLTGTFIMGAILALGRIVLRALKLTQVFGRLERAVLAFGLGASTLGSTTLITGRLGLLSPVTVRSALGVLIAVEGLLSLLDRFQGTDRQVEPALEITQRQGPRLRSRLGLLVVVAPFVLFMLLGSMLPPLDFDAIEYHLQGPKEYFQAGRISFLSHNVYTSMPFNVEMLHLLAMEVMNDWWWGALAGQLLVATFALWTAATIALTARQLVSPRAAWVATAVYLTTPWVYRLAVIPYVEGPLCFYHAATFWMAARALRAGNASPNAGAAGNTTSTESPAANGTHRIRFWAVAGLLAGGAMGCKYPALVSAVIPFGLVALVDARRQRTLRPVLAYCLGWALIMTPWLGKNLVDTGNPVYPLGYKVFGARYWNPSMDLKWWKVHGPRPVAAGRFGHSVLDVAGRSDWQSSLYVALAPLALLRPGSRRIAFSLWAYAVYLFLTWWFLTHRLDRFWLPIMPALAVLAGIGADWVRSRAWSALLGLVLAIGIATNLVYVSTTLAGFNEWTGDLRVLRLKIPFLIDRPMARIDFEVPPEAKVMVVGQAGVFHLTHPIIYNTVFNEELIEPITRGKSPEQVRREFVELGVSYVYVDWLEIERHRTPGGYGYAEYIQPELFERLVATGVFGPPVSLGAKQDLYRVRQP